MQPRELTIIKAAELVGWQPKSPSVEVETDNREICRDSTCSRCGHLGGLVYWPFTKPGTCRCGRFFRSFAECPNCWHLEEF